MPARRKRRTRETFEESSDVDEKQRDCTVQSSYARKGSDGVFGKREIIIISAGHQLEDDIAFASVCNGNG